MSIEDTLERVRRRNEVDAQRFADLDLDSCMACHAHGEDKRSLIISCGYDVSEVIPDVISLHLVEGLEGRGWYLRICKSCRASLLAFLGTWWVARTATRGVPKDHDGGWLEEHPDAYIPVRQHGAVTMMTFAEWERYRSEQDSNA